MTNSNIERLIDDHEITCLLQRPRSVDVSGARRLAGAAGETPVGPEPNIPSQPAFPDVFMGGLPEFGGAARFGQPV